MCRTSSRSTASQLIGSTELFCRLTWRLVAPPKPFRIKIRLSTSWRDGLMKIAASSASREHLKRALRSASSLRWPSSVAILRSLCRGSIARMNRYGDRGPPVLTPFDGRSFPPQYHLERLWRRRLRGSTPPSRAIWR